MNTRIPDADGTHRLGGSGDEPVVPADYFAPAAADPGAGRVFEPLRFPGRVEVTRAELGITREALDQVAAEGGSPVRAYLLRHLEEAQIQLGYAETALQDVASDHETHQGRVAMIVAALEDLDDLEAAANRSDHAEGDAHR